MNYDARRRRKIARALIRLKHSLAADDEIAQYLETEKRGLIEGVVVKPDIAGTIEEITGEG
jgi:hypothetical protein